MAYGEIKVDTITFTDGGIDKSVTISGLVQNPTFSGNIAVTGTISGNLVRGQTVSGVTVTGTTAQFTSGTFTSITGGTATITSGVFASGTAAAPTITFTGDPNTGIYSPGADQLALSTNGTGRLFIDSSGRVGIGTASPTVNLQINDPADARITVNDTGSGSSIQIRSDGTSSYIGTTSAHDLRLVSHNSERARIDSSGSLLVGTSTARAFAFGITPLQQIESATGSNGLSITTNRNDASSSILHFGKSRSAALGGFGIVSSNDSVGSIRFEAADGTQLVRAAEIRVDVDGTPGVNDMPGRLVFSITANGASSPTEQMSIGNAGAIFIGSTARTQSGFIQGASDGLKSYAASTTSTCRIECFHGGSTTVYHQVFSNANGIVGSIATAASATAYNTSSDYRLKENIVPVTDGITRLQQLKPSRFNFIADPTKTVDGFLAHEVQTIVPEAITGEKDAVDEDGNPQYQGIDQSKMVPLVVAALQEAIGEIELLKARVAALESV